MNDVEVVDIHIGARPDLSKFTLPTEAATQTYGIIGKRGVGKTHTGGVLTEGMLAVGSQVVVIDPLDVWWGLRASANGKGEGFPILVLGGNHGDLPLQGNSGTLIADLVVERGVSVVLSLRHLSKREQNRFVGDFCERVYDRKGEEQYRTPLHIMIDEADAFAPQRLQADQMRTFGAIDDIVRRGRSSGLGVTLITQRSAAINKDVLTQIEVLVTHRTISPQDRGAVEAWIEAHDAHDQRKEFMASLASLPVGTAWFWSPGWLDVFEMVRVRQRTTFDSSATPRAGDRPLAPSKLAPVDLEAIRSQLSATIEAAAANDPRELKRQIADLQKQLRARPTETKVGTVIQRVEVELVSAERIANLQEVARDLHAVAVLVGKAADDIAGDLARARAAPAPRPEPRPVPTRPQFERAPAATLAAERVTTDIKLGKAERAILNVLAQYPAGRTKRQVSILTGYALNGGGFNNALSRLRSDGLIEGRNELAVTSAGIEVAGDIEPLPQGPELLGFWLPKLAKAERLILEALHGAWPGELSKAELADATGYVASGGGFGNALGKLRTLELIEGRDPLRISRDFFE